MMRYQEAHRNTLKRVTTVAQLVGISYAFTSGFTRMHPRIAMVINNPAFKVGGALCIMGLSFYDEMLALIACLCFVVASADANEALYSLTDL